MPRIILSLLWSLASAGLLQAQSISGQVVDANDGQPLPFATVLLDGTVMGTTADIDGRFELPLPTPRQQTYTLVISSVGYTPLRVSVADSSKPVRAELWQEDKILSEVVVTGTMKAQRKDDSPIPVDIFSVKFFQRNAATNLVDNLALINGITPQVTCNVCNTSSISINGMEGPYTMILIDGMPNVSGLATVYGLSGIPNSMIDRIEIAKGPASTLYGSEAIAGVINVITKNATTAPRLSIDLFGTTEQEYNVDAAATFALGRASSLLGINYFNYQNLRDINGDNFTDLAQQNRFSIFNKWQLARRDKKIASLGMRYYQEDRWGGELDWTPAFRGGDEIYGESILTKRFEIFGKYQLPVKEAIFADFSYNDHDQDSAYGDSPFLAKQRVAFGQLYWDKHIGNRHDLLLGVAYRYTWYDDNTPATATADTLNPRNLPAVIQLPGVYVQDEINLSDKHKLLLGLRYDYNSAHGSVLTPRISYKYAEDAMNILRLTLGNGYRVVNIFTEDHAALISAREVVIEEDLKPERSYNVNANYVRKFFPAKGIITLDASLFYNYFTNQILPDYSDPNRIIYANLVGHAVTQGFALNADATYENGLRITAGATFIDTYKKEPNEQGVIEKVPQILASRFSATFGVAYTIPKLKVLIDYTGQVRGPMYMPVFPNDARPERSPWFTLQNLQLSRKVSSSLELYTACQNLFNFVPREEVILRAFDPFDRQVDIDNPNGFSFDPTYNYAPMQGRKFLLGLRWNLQ